MPSDLSKTLIDIYLEQVDPAKWAATQIVKQGRSNMTVGDAMDMIERIVRESWEMQRRREYKRPLATTPHG